MKFYNNVTNAIFLIGILIGCIFICEPLLAQISISNCPTPIGSKFALVLSDFHLNPFCGITDIWMKNVVRAAKLKWNISEMIVLGDIMHWAGACVGGPCRNLSHAEWNHMIDRYTRITKCAPHLSGEGSCTVIPGNHDLNDTITQRWISQFGPYNVSKQVLGTTLWKDSSLAQGLHGPGNGTILLTHYPLKNHMPVQKLCPKLVLTGHVHYSEIKTHTFSNCNHVITEATLPTLNYYQALENEHFDGSGENGFGILADTHQFELCNFYPTHGQYILVYVSSGLVIALISCALNGTKCTCAIIAAYTSLIWFVFTFL